MRFTAELKELSVKTIVSGDKSVQIKLLTDNIEVARELASIPSQSTVTVTIEATT